MSNDKIFQMSFSKLYSCLVAKAEKKGRTREEVNMLITCLLGYTPQQIENLADTAISYGDFFTSAPAINPNKGKITGTVCGVKIDEISDPLMQDIRRLDKMVDDLAKGKTVEKILSVMK